MTRLVSTKAVARELHVSPETVRVYARNGVIPSQSTPGGHRRYDLDAGAQQHRDRAEQPGRELPELREVDGRMSVGRPSDFERLAAGPHVNFDAETNGTLAPEIVALAGVDEDDRGVAPVQPYAENRVHGALMAWALPADIPAPAGR